MGSFVVAPTQVHPDRFRRYVRQCVVKDLDVGLGDFHEILVADVRKHQMAGHRQVRAVHLKQKAGLVDGVVLFLHHVGQPRQVGFPGRVVPIQQEMGYYPGRRCGHECFRWGRRRHGSFEIGDVFLHRLPAFPVDGTVTGGTDHCGRPGYAGDGLGKVGPVLPGGCRSFAIEPSQPVPDVG